MNEKVEGSKKFRLSFQIITLNGNGTGAIISLSKRYNSTHEDLLVLGLDGGHPSLSLSINGSTFHRRLGIDPLLIGNVIKLHVIEKKDELLFFVEKCNYYFSIRWHLFDCPIVETSLSISAAFNMSGATVCLGDCKRNISDKNFKYKRGSKETCVADLIINGVLQNMNSSSEVSSNKLICGEAACGVKKSSYGHCGKNAVCYGQPVWIPVYYCECKNGYSSNSDNQRSPCNISKFHQNKSRFIAKLEIRFLQFSVTGTFLGRFVRIFFHDFFTIVIFHYFCA